MPCLALFETEPSIKTLVCKYKSKYILDTFGEEIIALNPLIDVFQLDFEKFECCRLIVKATQVSDLFQCQIKYAFVHA